MTDGTLSRRNLLRRGAAAGALVAAPGILVACERTPVGTDQQTGGPSTLQKIKDAGVVNVGFANEGPYAFKNEQGELVGEAPAVHREIFKALGVPKLEPHVTDFGGLIPGLTHNRWDVITAGMYITPKRCAGAAFSEPVYSGDTAFLVKKGNPKNITSFEAIAKNPDTKLGVLQGTVERAYAERAGVDNSQFVTYDAQQNGLEGVTGGWIDALALTSFSLKFAVKTNPHAAVEVTKPFVPDPENVDCGAAAFRKGDTELIEAFNTELAKLKESGRLLELIKPWGFTETNIPPQGLTTEERCNRE